MTIVHDVDKSLALRFGKKHGWKGGDAYSSTLIGLNQSLNVTLVQEVSFAVIIGINLNQEMTVGNCDSYWM